MSRGIDILSGKARGIGPAVVRAGLRAAEGPYGLLMRVRNRLYDSQIKKIHKIDRPVISVGNITAGGSGKTPVVQWIAGRLIEKGIKPGIILRGYGKSAGISDEELLLTESLAGAVVVANPDRVAAARQIGSRVDGLILDDAFQHRRIHRDLDIVLIDATRPFGFNHVHPRGLLREPLMGLARAGALVITRSDLAPTAEIERTLRRYSDAPIHRARHVITGFRTSAGEGIAISDLAGRPYVLAAGIGNPGALIQQLDGLGGQRTGECLFPDHYAYSKSDCEKICAGNPLVLTTEKDWVKLRAFGPANVWRISLAVRFQDDGLLDQVVQLFGR